MEVVVYTPEEILNQDSAEKRHRIFATDTLNEINFLLTRHVIQDWNVLKVSINVNIIDVVEAELVKAGWHAHRGWSFAAKPETGKASVFGSHVVDLHISALPFEQKPEK